MPGEFDFIHWVRSQQAPSDFVPVPAGDDLAVVRWDAADLLLAGVDQVLDGVHFDSAIHPPRLIGRKVMNRNLSDCAAMACLPAVAVATVALPKTATLEYAQELYLGMRDAADPFDCRIVGGDTASWANPLVVTVTILGRSAGVAPVTRAGAQVGDGIFVTGALGGSLHLPTSVSAHLPGVASSADLRTGRHMLFTPRVHEARQLARQYRITAMIDLSDGLSRDLGHICRMSNVGALIDAAAVPIHEHARLWSLAGRDPLASALHDGEDYELLFTSPDPIAPDLATRIGQVTPEDGLFLRTATGIAPLRPMAWEHKLGERPA